MFKTGDLLKLKMVANENGYEAKWRYRVVFATQHQVCYGYILEDEIDHLFLETQYDAKEKLIWA